MNEHNSSDIPLRMVPRQQNVVDTLQERAKTHGDYGEKAEFIQHVKDSFRMTPNWMSGTLTGGQQEALDSIALKIGRILFGDPTERDHWLDGAGYFNLGGGWKP